MNETNKNKNPNPNKNKQNDTSEKRNKQKQNDRFQLSRYEHKIQYVLDTSEIERITSVSPEISNEYQKHRTQDVKHQKFTLETLSRLEEQ